MRFRFLHFSDAHLGYQQYNQKERFNDFGRAFLHIVDQAIARRVDFVVFSGDLFHKRSLDPPTLLQAVEGLERLREADIPMIAVEGNHERPHYRDVHSWLDFLAAQEYLILLTPAMQDGRPLLASWDDARGCYHDVLPGVRVYGVKYYGAATPRVVEGMAQALEGEDHSSIQYVVLAMHAGVEGVIPHASAVLTQAQLAPLRDHIDYLAMGHIHKPFEREDWMYNPGSPETCGMDEAAWTDRGYYLVDVDTSKDPKHQAKLVQNPRRAFHRLRFGVDHCDSPQALYSAVKKLVSREARDGNGDEPVVELTLEGVLAFERRDLDRGRLEAIVEEAFSPLVARLTDRTVSTEYEIDSEGVKSRTELEHEVIADLVERDARYRPAARDWADLIIDIKRMALESTSPQAIVEHVRRRRAELEGEA